MFIMMLAEKLIKTVIARDIQLVQHPVRHVQIFVLNGPKAIR